MLTANSGFHSSIGVLTAMALGCAEQQAATSSQSAPAVDGAQMLSDVAFLAADSLEGRLVGSRGNLLAREYVAARFAALGLAPLEDSHVLPFAVTRGGTNLEGANVIGRLDGASDPEWSIVITAHYDGLGVRDGEVFNGADDNASGTAALLALAAYLAEHQPSHTVIFAAVDAEEGGISGSEALVKHPAINLDRVAVNVNLDMISHSERELYVAGVYHYPFLKGYVDRATPPPEIDLLLGHDRPELGDDDWTNASDHAPFHQAGVPFLYFGVEDHEDYHQATDVLANINRDFYVRAVNTILDVVTRLDGDLEPVIAQRVAGQL